MSSYPPLEYYFEQVLLYIPPVINPQTGRCEKDDDLPSIRYMPLIKALEIRQNDRTAVIIRDKSATAHLSTTEEQPPTTSP